MKTQIGFVETLTISGANTYLSTPMNVKIMDDVSFAIRASAGPTTGAAIVVLYSNDYQPAPPGDTNPDQLSDLTKWDTYVLNTTVPAAPTLSGAGQSGCVRLPFYEFAWVRLKFVITAGSGTILCAYWGKTL